MISLKKKANEFESRLQLERIAGIRSVDLDHPFLQMFCDPFSLFEIDDNISFFKLTLKCHCF